MFILVGLALPFSGTADVTEAPAYLVASTQAQWSDPEIELCLRSGDLPRGLLRLDSGSAEFLFRNGASAMLLGPATVRFTGPDSLLVQDGQVLCRCPTTDSRITVATPTTQVVDLGTEFAVAVARQPGSTRVAVIQGEVRVGTQATDDGPVLIAQRWSRGFRWDPSAIRPHAPQAGKDVTRMRHLIVHCSSAPKC